MLGNRDNDNCLGVFKFEQVFDCLSKFLIVSLVSSNKGGVGGGRSPPPRMREEE